MEYIEFYFLDYKYKVFTEKTLLSKIREFWKGFLIKEKEYKKFKEWEVLFIKDKKSSTKIDYEKKVIEHRHNSICDLTEFNNLFREIIVKISAMDGMVWLHCSAFMVKDKTILVVGKKGYGKTTLLLNAITNMGAEFIGNDQIPLLIENNDIYCYSWRPDVKVCTNRSKKSECKLEKIFKTLYLVNNTIPYNFINFKSMSKRLGKQVIPPVNDLNIQCTEHKLNKVDYIFVLYNQKDITELKNTSILEYIIDDPETILQFKLRNLREYMPYWNKRIVDINVKKEAEEENSKIINLINNKCKTFLVGNRIEFSLVQEFINMLIDKGR